MVPVHAYRKNNIFFWHLEAASAECSSSPSHQYWTPIINSPVTRKSSLLQNTAVMMITLRDPQKVISPAGWSPPLGWSPQSRWSSQVITTKPGDRLPAVITPHNKWSPPLPRWSSPPRWSLLPIEWSPVPFVSDSSWSSAWSWRCGWRESSGSSAGSQRRRHVRWVTSWSGSCWIPIFFLV